MKVCLATTFAFYLKGHNFHWNVEGPDFMQYHQLFEMVYSDAWGAVDGLAEHIRAIDAYAPGSLSRFSQLSVVDDQINIPSALKMVRELQLDNDTLKGELVKAQRLAENEGQTGLANYLQDRIDIHSKHGWMLRATLKG